MKLTPKRRELIAAVRAHAVENYDSGWDVVVECHDDESIASVMGKARTLKGALARFAPILDVINDRRAEAEFQIREAVGEPAAATEHYRVVGGGYWQQPGCACGREYATDKAADLHVVAEQQKAGTYEPTQQGHHPDGSFVHWRHDEHTGDAWAVRTWGGKACRASIEIVETETGYETVESYRPAWKGATIYSPGHCDHDPSVPF